LKEDANELLNAATARIRNRLQNEPNQEELHDLHVLDSYLELTQRINEGKSALKKAETDLDSKAYAKYPLLKEAEMKTLVVCHKWLFALDAAIHGEMDRISQTLTQRVKELAERYENPMPQMVNHVAELEGVVNQHFRKMGYSW
jgi:type I restriction enzyme M protein